MIRLLPITAAVVQSLADSDEFARVAGTGQGEVSSLVRDVVVQGEVHRAKTGAPEEWGGFLAIDDTRHEVVGTCAFTAAPDAAGEVEIAYYTFPPFEGQGHGSAMAGALLAHAAALGAVRLVYAYTLMEVNASTRILAKHGFTQVGTAQDHEAGLVWRWERLLLAAPRT